MFFVIEALFSKRTAFPSSVSALFGLKIAAWFRLRKLSSNVEFAGGDRFQRSGRSFTSLVVRPIFRRPGISGFERI